MPIRRNPQKTLRKAITDGAENRLLSNCGTEAAAARPADGRQVEAARENLVKWVQALGLSKQESAQLLSHVFYGSQRAGGDIEQAAQCVAEFAAAMVSTPVLAHGGNVDNPPETTDESSPDAVTLRAQIESMRQHLLTGACPPEETATLSDWLQVAEAFLADGAYDEARVTLDCIEQAIRVGASPW